ncbi:MAG: InlB B-repeat-containing protein, partial [Bacillota bacterium]
MLIGVAACGITPDTESDVLTVEFETNGGEAIESVDVEVGDILTLPTPEREGYRFEGWYALEDLSGSSLSEFPAVTGGTITLYANWIQTRFTLTFDSMGGTPIDPMVKNEGDALAPPETPIREGYTFLGWFTDNLFTEAFSFDAVLEQDSNLFAAWEGNDYTITFNERGGSDVPDITAAYEEAIEAPTSPTRIGYTFDGWYLDDTFDDAFTFDTMPLDGATLYAKWDPALVDVTIHRYTEDLDQEGYTLETTEVVEAYTESTYTLEQSSIPGFTPDPGHDSSVTSGTVLADGSLELTLYYSRDEITLTYETNADFSIASSSGLFEAPLSAPEDPERLGYIFEGWFSDPDFETEYVFSTFPAQDTTIYADWEGTPSTIHFNSHGGSAVESLTANNGDAITLIEPTRDGYDFEGWYLSDDYLNVFDDTTMPVGGASLHAKWKPATYTLTFETGEGSAIDALELGFGEALTLPDDPVLDGHAFTGWFMDSEFTEPYDLSTMPSNDLTVYARFIENTNPNSVINQTTQDEGSAVEVHGVVYHTFTSAYQGFMIFDETGQVFINHSHNGLEIGDRVTIEGVLEFDEGIPLIAGVEDVSVVSSDHPTKTAKPMDFEDFKDLAPTRHTVHDVYTLHGLFHKMSDDYYLIDFDNTDFGLPVYYKSYLPDHIALLDDSQSERVDLTFAWVQTDEGPVLSLIDIEDDPLSDDEILDLIKAFAEEALGTPDFQPGDILDMPSNDPLNLTTIAVEAVGDNADYFDP